MQKSWGNFFANTEFRWHLITWSAFYALQTLRRCLLLWKCLFHFPDATPTPTHSAHFPGHITTDMTTLLAKWIVHNLTSRNFNCSCDRIKFYLKFPPEMKDTCWNFPRPGWNIFLRLSYQKMLCKSQFYNCGDGNVFIEINFG